MTKPGDEVRRPRQERPAKSSYQQHLDDRLDEALKETFPASDPVAVTPRRGEPPMRPEPTSRRTAR